MDFKVTSKGAGGFNYTEVVEGKTLKIPENTQHFVYGDMVVNGDIELDGELVLYDDPLGVIGNAVTITATTATLNDTNDIVFINAASNAVTVTLPAAADNISREYELICTDSTNVVSITGNGSETISGDLTITLVQYEAISIISDGTNWMVY